MSDIKLDTATHDILIDKHDVVLIDGADAIQQQLRIRMQFFLGEWFLDTREGIPYYRDILIKNPSLSIIRDIFRKAIITTPGVVSVDNLDVTVDSKTRTATVAFRATLDTGEVLNFEPFIIEVF